jgi:hypothetical protein
LENLRNRGVAARETSGTTIFLRPTARKRRKRQNSNPDRPLGRKVLFDFIFFGRAEAGNPPKPPYKRFFSAVTSRRKPLFRFFRGAKNAYKEKN